MVDGDVVHFIVSQQKCPFNSFIGVKLSHLIQWAKGGVAIVMWASHSQIKNICYNLAPLILNNF